MAMPGRTMWGDECGLEDDDDALNLPAFDLPGLKRYADCGKSCSKDGQRHRSHLPPKA